MTNGTGGDGRTGALYGLTVLDLTGPEGQPCGRILADLGADVILIEPPSGSPSRRMAPFAHGEAGPDRSLFFVHFNTNKRGITLDLDTEDGRARFLELVKNADIVLESGHPGEMEARGLGYDDLAAVNPGIIVTSITPYGRTGPYRDFVGADIAVTALGGSVYVEGEVEGPPVNMPRYQGFQLSSTHAAFGTLIALWRRRTTGRGQHLDVAMTEVHAHMNMHLMRYAALSEVSPRRGSHGGNGPTQYFQTSDGEWVQLALTTPRQWVEFAEWVNHPLLLDPAMRELSARDAKSDEINAIAGEFISKITAEEYLRDGVEKHVTIAPANSPADFAAHPHAEAYGFFSPIEHPVLGTYNIPAGSAVFGASPLSVRRPAPTLGQHQDEVLASASTEPVAVPAGGSNGSTGSGLPLDGVRVLAFERVWAAPFGTRFVADYGADVIKVESTKFADGRVFDREGNPTAWRSTNASFAENNRNKRSIAIDLHMPEGQELFKRLAAEADIVVENNAPGAMDRFNINWDALREVNPRLIMISCPGYGAMGPMKDFVAVGQCLTSFTGLGYLWASTGRAMARAWPGMPTPISSPPATLRSPSWPRCITESRRARDSTSRFPSSRRQQASLGLRSLRHSSARIRRRRGATAIPTPRRRASMNAAAAIGGAPSPARTTTTPHGAPSPASWDVPTWPMIPASPPSRLAKAITTCSMRKSPHGHAPAPPIR